MSLTFEKTGPSQFVVGKCFDYVLTLTNSSQEGAFNVVFTDTLPAGVTFVSVSGTEGIDFAFDFSNGVVTASVAALGGGSFSVIIRVRPDKKCTLTNTATVSGQASGPFAFEDTLITTPLKCTSKWAIQRWKQCEAIEIS